jgi:kynurenine 3-monooxygenase
MIKVIIVGAGPSGVLLAHYLLHRSENYYIDIYERRSDPRKSSFSQSRTFPISLSERGMTALRKIEGLEDAIKAVSMPTTGSVSHQKNGKKRVIRRDKPFFTLNRTSLVIALLEKLLEKDDNNRIHLHFDYKCTQVDFAAKTVTFQNVRENHSNLTVQYDRLVGADGAGSAVREQFLNTEDFECQQDYVSNDYKSIFLPNPEANPEINLEKGKLHAWRLQNGTIVLMLHQLDGSMHGVIHFPRQNKQIAELSTTQEVLQFFQENFPEIGQLMPESEAEDFLARPISSILKTRCNRYHQGDSVLMVGDAVHSVSPSIGQGCNSALEDIVFFDRLLDEYSDNWKEAIEQFTIRRKPDAHALVELSDYTFPSAPSLVIEFILRERLAKFLHQLFPKYFSPPIFQLLFNSTPSYSEILNSHQGWINKVKKSNEKLLKA